MFETQSIWDTWKSLCCVFPDFEKFRGKSCVSQIRSLRNWVSTSANSIRRLPEDMKHAFLASIALTVSVNLARAKMAGLSHSQVEHLLGQPSNLALQIALQTVMFVPNTRSLILYPMLVTNQFVTYIFDSQSAYFLYLAACICLQTAAHASMVWQSLC